MRARVSSEMRDEVLAPFSTAEAAMMETPASRPTSASVAACRARVDLAGGLAMAGSDDAAGADGVGVVAGGQLGRAYLRLEVAVDDAEAALVAVFPLVIVDERPQEVAVDGHAVADGAVHFAQVVAQVVAPVQVMHLAVHHRLVVVAAAVLGDVD